MQNLPLAQRLRVWALRGLIALLRVLTLFRSKPKPPGEVTEFEYGGRPGETLLVISPAPTAPKRAPVVYVHGGGWIAGAKEMYTADLYFLAEEGHPVFNLEYPLAPDNPHPGILLSLLRALDWIRTHHPDCTHAHFMGDSAGGNLVAMLGLMSENPERLRDLGPEAPARIAVECLSVESIYGVLDRLSWLKNGFPLATAMLESYGGKAAFAESVGPELAITPMDLEFDSIPPLYLCGASKDPLCESTRIFAERVKGCAREVQVEIFEGEQHGFFNLAGREASQELRRQMLSFMARHEPGHRAPSSTPPQTGVE